MKNPTPEGPDRTASTEPAGRQNDDAPRSVVPWLVTWSIACALGFAMLWTNSAAPCAAAAPHSWPVNCGIERANDRLTVVMFAHPRCSCTRASIAEFDRLAAQSGACAKLVLCFFQPAGAWDDRHHADPWRAAASSPSITVHRDEDGATARRFGPHTSGQVLAYDRSGVLAFHGEITGQRGDAGIHRGLDALVALARGSAPEQQQTPVFGCPLHDDPNTEGSH